LNNRKEEKERDQMVLKSQQEKLPSGIATGQVIAARLSALRSEIPPGVKIVAVSKTIPVEDILVAYNAGQRIFGENRAQEILRKKDNLPADIEWHMIGHLQTNKVRQLAPFISMVSSVDSFKLLSVLDSEAQKAGREIGCLLQVHIAEEETKTGFSIEDLLKETEVHDFKSMKGIRIRGVMGMATFTNDQEQVRKEFRHLVSCFRTLAARLDIPEFTEISIGMSGDYRIAVEEGSTMIRIGSLIFGDRKKQL
jgi:PLP dependent protein